MLIFLKPNEAQSYFTTSWILSKGTEKDKLNWVPWCFSVGNLSSLNSEGILSLHLSNHCHCETGIFPLWGLSLFKEEETYSPSRYCTTSYLHYVSCQDRQDTKMHVFRAQHKCLLFNVFFLYPDIFTVTKKKLTTELVVYEAELALSVHAHSGNANMLMHWRKLLPTFRVFVC